MQQLLKTQVLEFTFDSCQSAPHSWKALDLTKKRYGTF